jgi:hypothetical protein
MQMTSSAANKATLIVTPANLLFFVIAAAFVERPGQRPIHAFGSASMGH